MARKREWTDEQERDIVRAAKDVFHHNTLSGDVIRVKSRYRKYVNTEAGTIDSDGYCAISFVVGRKKLILQATDVIWALHHDRLPYPTHVIKHLNGNRLDNRLDNLEEQRYTVLPS